MYNVLTLVGTYVLSVATDILAGITEYVTGIGDMLIDLFKSMTTLFYTPAVGETPATLTIIGWLGLFSIGYGLVVRVAIPFVRRFFVR